MPMPPPPIPTETLAPEAAPTRAGEGEAAPESSSLPVSPTPVPAPAPAPPVARATAPLRPASEQWVVLAGALVLAVLAVVWLRAGSACRRLERIRELETQIAEAHGQATRQLAALKPADARRQYVEAARLAEELVRIDDTPERRNEQEELRELAQRPLLSGLPPGARSIPTALAAFSDDALAASLASARSRALAQRLPAEADVQALQQIIAARIERLVPALAAALPAQTIHTLCAGREGQLLAEGLQKLPADELAALFSTQAESLRLALRARGLKPGIPDPKDGDPPGGRR